jgi:hypothetical protein
LKKIQKSEKDHFCNTTKINNVNGARAPAVALTPDQNASLKTHHADRCDPDSWHDEI